MRKIAVMEVAFGGMRDTIMIELFPNDAPQTVANFINHCESGLYNGLAFHRAIEGFLVQTGDPLTSDESAREKWGTGGEDKTIPAEIKRPHRIGAVAMARRSDKVNPQRRSNGSQFYVTLGNYGAIDNKYTVFGQVVSGLETMKRISVMPVDSNDCPIARIEVKSIKVIDQKGPLQVQPEVAGEGQRYSKPDSARGFVGRFLHRVW
jgi:cyclophilin family peptidyl-prolyl cis-trans isomerase